MVIVVFRRRTVLVNPTFFLVCFVDFFHWLCVRWFFMSGRSVRLCGWLLLAVWFATTIFDYLYDEFLSYL